MGFFNPVVKMPHTRIMPISFRTESRFLPKTKTFKYGLDENSPHSTKKSRMFTYSNVEDTTERVVPARVVNILFRRRLYGSDCCCATLAFSPKTCMMGRTKSPVTITEKAPSYV
jgi:hypothetical protein